MWRSLIASALSFGALATAAPAQAAFPGRNGRIAYATFEEAGISDFPFIATVRADGTGRRRFFDPSSRPECHAERSPCPAYGPSYSPRGGRLLATADLPGGTFYVIPSHDGRRARLLKKRRSVVYGLASSWSPDGHAVLYSDSGEQPRPEPSDSIRRLRANRTRRLGQGTDPQWSRRGRIAFVRLEGPELEPAVYTMNPKGGGIRRIGPGSGPDWSPHGRWLTFTTRDGRVVMTNGAETRTLVRPVTFAPCEPLLLPDGGCVPVVPCEPAFSPDGRWIVFGAKPLFSGAHERAGNECQGVGFAGLSFIGSLYVMRLDGSGLKRIVPRPSAQPSWQPIPRQGR